MNKLENLIFKLREYGFTFNKNSIQNEDSFNKVYDLFLYDIKFDPIIGAEYCYVGVYYFYIKQDYETAKHNYLIAIDKYNDINAMKYLGYLYIQELNYEMSEKYYLMAIEKKDVKTMKKLANFYYFRLKNYEKAITYYLMAIEFGHVSSMRSLAFLYERLKDRENAIKYHLMAIKHNGVDAVQDLVYYYEHSLHDYDNAKKYMLMAIEQGDESLADGMVRLYKKTKENPFKILDFCVKYHDFINKNLIINEIDIVWNLEFDPDKKLCLINILLLFEFTSKDDLPTSFFIFLNLLRKNIDLIKTHFKYAIGCPGFHDAKQEFMNLIS